MFRKFFQALARRKQQAAIARQEKLEAFLAELRSPEYGLIEEKFGRPISASLKALYEDKEELTRDCLTKIVPGQSEDKWFFVACYWPLKRSCLDGPWLQFGDLVPFAGDGAGNDYVVDPTDDDAEIKFFDHETGELKPTGVLMSAYLSLPEE